MPTRPPTRKAQSLGRIRYAAVSRYRVIFAKIRSSSEPASAAGGASSLLDGRKQPIAAARAAERPQFGHFARLATLDDAPAGAFDHAVLEREPHGDGRIVGTTFAPSFRQIALQQLYVSGAIDQAAARVAGQ